MTTASTEPLSKRVLVDIGVVDHRQRPRIGDWLGEAIVTRRVGRLGLLTTHFGDQYTTGHTGTSVLEPVHPLSQRVLVGRVRVRGPDVAHGSRRRELRKVRFAGTGTCRLTVRFPDRL
ncbi:MAG: hypothetical protein OXG04_19055 [Acidobacteria bacterium]|nr:hypothetical protein [Acidobacteriota bacterium]